MKKMSLTAVLCIVILGMAFWKCSKNKGLSTIKVTYSIASNSVEQLDYLIYIDPSNSVTGQKELENVNLPFEVEFDSPNSAYLLGMNAKAHRTISGTKNLTLTIKVDGVVIDEQKCSCPGDQLLDCVASGETK